MTEHIFTRCLSNYTTVLNTSANIYSSYEKIAEDLDGRTGPQRKQSHLSHKQVDTITKHNLASAINE